MLEYFKQLYDAWSALEKAQAEERKARLLIEEVFRGELSDLSLLPQLYAWYQQIAAENGFKSDARNSNRKQFVFVVLTLYAPTSLCGGKMSNDLRRAITALLQLRSHTILYHMRDKAVAWNKTYKTFSSEVEVAYEQIYHRLHDLE